MNTSYFLQLSEPERKSLHRQTQKASNAKDRDDIDAIHGSLEALQPSHKFILEIPDEYDAGRIKFVSSLEIPTDVIVVRTSGNRVYSEPVEHVRDGDRIKRVVAALEMGAILNPLAAGLTVLARVVSDACESAAPEIATVLDALYGFAPIFARATAETARLQKTFG